MRNCSPLWISTYYGTQKFLEKFQRPMFSCFVLFFAFYLEWRVQNLHFEGWECTEGNKSYKLDEYMRSKLKSFENMSVQKYSELQEYSDFTYRWWHFSCTFVLSLAKNIPIAIAFIRVLEHRCKNYECTRIVLDNYVKQNVIKYILGHGQTNTGPSRSCSWHDSNHWLEEDSLTIYLSEKLQTPFYRTTRITQPIFKTVTLY